ncbi:MAG: hypothetical protein J0J01_04080 [Reyranella sp.]|uniref:hypothetical protein n=1 Tax=Reyranella sp. TaxID=1929291 RepID=UPI001AC1DFA5|nr:hypothetical protein [Reyranella sp.]MBN9086066.1 hypothetical protein [Reyranella sp.]
MSFSRWIAIVTLTLLPTMGFAQAPQSQIVPAPAFHAATKVTFPDRIADASRTRSIDYGKSYNEPRLGQSWHYQVPQTLSASIYLYTLGQTAIPNGATAAAVLQQFQQSQGELSQSGKYERVAVLKGPADCVVGSMTFRCVVETGTVVSTRSADKLQLLVTGFRNHFLKVRLDWHQNSPQGDAAAERFLQALASQVLR